MQACRGRSRRLSQSFKCFLGQTEFLATQRKDTIGFGYASRLTDTATSGYLDCTVLWLIEFRRAGEFRIAECSPGERVRVHVRHDHLQWHSIHMEYHLTCVKALDGGNSCSGYLCWESDIELESKRLSNFVLKEVSQASVLRINTADKVAFIQAQAEVVVPLFCAWLPHRFLPSKKSRDSIEVCQYPGMQWLVDDTETSLVRQQLPDRNVLFAPLCKFRPVGSDRFVVVEEPLGMGQRHRHRGHPFGHRKDKHQGIFLPGGLTFRIPVPTPEIHHFFALMIDGAGRS